MAGRFGECGMGGLWCVVDRRNPGRLGRRGDPRARWGKTDREERASPIHSTALKGAGREAEEGQLMALHAACRLLSADEEAKVCWIDTTSSFSPERARKVLELLEAQVSRAHNWDAGKG